MIKDASQILFEKLTEQFPAPWRLVYHKMEAHHGRQYVAEVICRNAKSVMKLETYSGDGDLFFLGSEGAEALVEFINSMQ